MTVTATTNSNHPLWARLRFKAEGYGIATYRLMRLIENVIVYGARAAKQTRAPLKHREGQQWARQIINHLNIEVEIEGAMTQTPALIVANHQSYLDILAILHVVPCAFLCKEEVAHWPVLGKGIRSGGTLFVSRGSMQSRRDARRHIQRALESGSHVAVFPEGTTSPAGVCGPFKPGAFGCAIAAKVPTVPIAISYEGMDRAWVGDDSFLEHFYRVFSQPTTRIRVRIGAPQWSTSALDARDTSEAWVRQALHALEAKRGQERRADGASVNPLSH